MILAIDPGLTTGYALWGAPACPGFSSGMVKGRFEFYEWLYGLLTVWYKQPGSRPFQIVMERFTITVATAKKSPQPDPLYIIGHVEAIAHRDGIPFEFQLPSQAMSFATNDKLKSVGWYKPGAGHDNDAARHLLLWMVRYPPKGTGLLKELSDKLGISFDSGPETPTIEVVQSFGGIR